MAVLSQVSVDVPAYEEEKKKPRSEVVVYTSRATRSVPRSKACNAHTAQ